MSDSTSEQQRAASTGRAASIERNTKETQISLRLDLDGSGQSRIDTGVAFFDHMLSQIPRHALVDMQLQAKGDLDVDDHHTVEDVGIVVGQALDQCIGEKRGIVRYGHALVPLDEALGRVVIDFSGRPGLFFRVDFPRARIGQFDVDLVREFFQGMVNHARVTLHIDSLAGSNAHHICETLFKAFARALRTAVAIDARAPDAPPSTKGVL